MRLALGVAVAIVVPLKIRDDLYQLTLERLVQERFFANYAIFSEYCEMPIVKETLARY